jgi:uncharacterized protein
VASRKKGDAMQWRGRRGSDNIDDRRARGGGGARAGGIGGVGLIAVLVIAWFFGVDPSAFLNDPGAQNSAPRELTAEDQQAGEFVSVTLADTEQVWEGIFNDQIGRAYDPPTLVLFSGATDANACGTANGATGPFYCPADKQVYLDTDFFVTLERRLGAGGDFAAAYVVAHEVAHSVQDQLGILGQANQVRAQSSQEDSNFVSVQIELQADCFSGVWANHARGMGGFTREDFLEALNAAQKIGDDTLQANAGQRPMPHTFTHGTSEQRARWFLTGLQSGNIADCDTFSAQDL